MPQPQAVLWVGVWIYEMSGSLTALLKAKSKAAAACFNGYSKEKEVTSWQL